MAEPAKIDQLPSKGATVDQRQTQPAGPVESPDYLDVHGIVAHLRSRGARKATVNFARRLMAELGPRRIGKAFYVSKQRVDEWLERPQRRAR